MVSGIWLPIVTPFRSGEVDLEALRYLAAHYLRTGISGIVALGTTGEAALLSEAERLAVVQTLTDVLGSRLPVMIGVGGPDTRQVIREIQRYEHWDCAGFLVSAPSYICPDQSGIRWHFEQVAQATRRSVVLYNVPHRTGVNIECETVAQLLEHDNIVAIKECVPAHFSPLSTLPLDTLCGVDEAFLDCLAVGGTGGILASSHVLADLLVEVQDLATDNRPAEARMLFDRLIPTIQLLFSAPNPAAIKSLLAFDHPVSDETRMPIAPASARLVERLRSARDQLQDLRAEFELSAQ
ncbi:4-hydroxy-tetrahydrodipicolinate synthase family protein [Paraburkholderia metrosideri]|uniref:4-hydroxy-tetrahydrodipicolinate synthase n=1 Tax=Paraburkholderia metrosideri TaxID=580937 RepID=A0ABM8P3H5_9BURK|nr:4-hydroxy-tetrahydrodipicolinate synthase [Paraburkholderia metrosideri]CAD6555411.1 4-hydroxy-tetrahydrodipicolinate synthase [Paraburkholderia metrosideri]